MNFNNNRLQKLFPFILILLIFISRLPLITSLYFEADGDESIIGLMAKDIADHNHYKLFFWGQHYGLVTFETSAAALSFKIFGMNEYSLKLTMLFLWALGCLLLYGAAKNLTNFKTAVFFVFILIACPAWGLGSMKAYIAAFVFSSLSAFLLSIIQKASKNKSAALWLALGACLTIIYFTQKLFLLPLLPFLIAVLYQKARILNISLFCLGIIIIGWLITFLSRNEQSSFWPETFANQVYLFNSLPKIPAWQQTHFTGAYYLANIYRCGFFNSFSAWAWVIIFFLLLALQLYRLISERFYLYSFLLCISSVLSASVMFFDGGKSMNYRYLLPLNAPLILWLVAECFYLAKDKWKPALNYVLAAFILINFIGLSQLRKTPIDASNLKATKPFSTSMLETLSFLKQNNIHYAFTRNELLKWQVDFYSNGAVLARGIDSADRNPELMRPVTNAFKSGKPIALIDFYNSDDLNSIKPAEGINPAQIHSFGNQFSVFLNPDKVVIKKLNFKF